MTKRIRLLLLGAVVMTPLAASACTIPLGNGCDLVVGEPGAQVGVVCNF